MIYQRPRTQERGSSYSRKIHGRLRYNDMPITLDLEIYAEVK